VNISCPTHDLTGDPALRQSCEPSASVDGSFSVRPFGRQKADLDFDFTSDDRPRLVTGILTACLSEEDGSPFDAEEIWNLAVSRRIECLLWLVAASRDFDWRLTLRCPGRDCLQLIEIELPLRELITIQRDNSNRSLLEWQDDATILRLRRPTGDDQRRWRARSFADVTEARNAVIKSLVVGEDGPLTIAADAGGASDSPPALVEAIDERLEEFDPLVAFCVQVHCPHCGDETGVPLDLEEFALKELEKIQQQELESIHQLAGRYHWSESEIVELPRERRARYLRLIAAEDTS
jgi:hypothetical protein